MCFRWARDHEKEGWFWREPDHCCGVSDSFWQIRDIPLVMSHSLLSPVSSDISSRSRMLLMSIYIPFGYFWNFCVWWNSLLLPFWPHKRSWYCHPHTAWVRTVLFMSGLLRCPVTSQLYIGVTVWPLPLPGSEELFMLVSVSLHRESSNIWPSPLLLSDKRKLVLYL